MKQFRTLSKIKYVWHGAWSDPELIYKKHSFNYWDIEDMFFEMFKEDTQDTLPNMFNSSNEQIDQLIVDEKFNNWLKDNKERCYCSLDDLLTL